MTPIFAANDLVARGVQMEAESIEDGGQAIRFNVFVYNVEPGVEIDYVTGKSWESSDVPSMTTGGEATTTGAGSEERPAVSSNPQEYVLNTKSMKFHRPTCSSVDDIADNNKQEATATRDELISEGYSPCKQCNP